MQISYNKVQTESRLAGFACSHALRCVHTSCTHHLEKRGPVTLPRSVLFTKCHAMPCHALPALLFVCLLVCCLGKGVDVQLAYIRVGGGRRQASIGKQALRNNTRHRLTKQNKTKQNITQAGVKRSMHVM